VRPLPPPPPFTNLALADFFLLRKVKEKLASFQLFQESLKNDWEETIRSIGKDEFDATFRRLYERGRVHTNTYTCAHTRYEYSETFPGFLIWTITINNR
jgi:hypothetical protein